MNFFKRRYLSMKRDAEKFASSRNVPLKTYSFFEVFYWVMIASSILSMFTLTAVSSINLPDHIIVTIMLNMIIPVWGLVLFFGLGKYFFYARILEIHYTQKVFAYLINKLDMMWWRKYKKQSPLTEGLFKMQSKAQKVDKRFTKGQKRLISICLVLLIVCAYGYMKLPVLEEIITGVKQDIKQAEIKEKNLGKIFDGLNGKLENHT